jgi:O-antigen/teichoic acid export membrane protein
MFCNFSFLVSEKTALITKFNFWTAAVVTVGNLALIPPFGALGAALAQVLAASFQFAVIQRSARACFDMGLKYGDGFRLLLIASIAYLVAEYGTTSLEFWPAVAVRGLVFVVFLGIVTRSLLQEPTIRGAARSLLQRLRSRST